MRSIHSFVLALTLGFLGLAFTTSPSSAMIDTGDKASCCAKAACCVEGAACCVEGAACCAKKGDAATCAMKMEKGKKGACCAEGASCCAEGASCCAKAKTDKAV